MVWKPDGSYGIQVGAYSKYDAAQKAAQSATKAAPQLLSEARILIDTQKMNNGSKLYRARGRPQQDRCPGRLPKTQSK